MIEFTFTHERYIQQVIKTKYVKYHPLIETTKTQGWQVDPLKVITTAVRGAKHTNNIEELKSLHKPMPLKKNHMKKCILNYHNISHT